MTAKKRPLTDDELTHEVSALLREFGVVEAVDGNAEAFDAGRAPAIVSEGEVRTAQPATDPNALWGGKTKR